MRILYINDYEAMGGKESYLAQVRGALRDAGHVTAFIHSRPSSETAIEKTEISFSVPGLDTYRRTADTVDRLRECIALFKPDVIHINYNVVNLIAVRWMLWNHPVIRSVHDVEYLCPIRYYVRANTGKQCDAPCGTICFSSGCLSATDPKSLYRLGRTRAAQWLYAKRAGLNTQSRYMETNLLQTTGKPEHISVLPVFVAEREWSNLPSESAAHFVYTGRLNRWKGPQTAIQAMTHLPGRSTLEVVGEGEMAAQLNNLVRSLKLESRVRFAGYVTGDRLFEKYSRAIAAVLPNIMPENCPMTIQEAMAAGRAVISTTVGGIPDLLENGVSGYLVPPDKPIELAAAMQRLIDDPELAETFGRNGRRKMSEKQYQRGYHLKALLDEYRETMEKFRALRKPSI